MENNVQVSGNSNGGGGDAFARTAVALASAADSLAMEFQRRKAAEVEAQKREEQATADLRQKLVNIHEKIGQLLGTVGGETTPRRGRPAGSKNRTAEETQRGRAPNEETVRAKDKVLAFLKANPGMSRGDIAKNTKLDTSLVGRVLQILADDGVVKMSGERRGAVWTAK